MSKPTRLFVLRATQDAALAARLIERVNATGKSKGEVLDPARPPGESVARDAWYVLLLSKELGRSGRELNWVMDAHPDRVLPVLVRDCDPGAVHPRLDFLPPPRDFRTGTDKNLDALLRDWNLNGVDREKADCSILMFLSLKGGVAKTTNAVAVAECLAEQGNRVLVIDTDHQCGASGLLLGEDNLEGLEERRRTLADLFFEALNRDFDPDRIGHFAAKSTSIPGLGERLRVIPGSIRLEDFWSYFKPTENRDAKDLKEGYDYLRNKRKDVFSRWLKQHYDFVIVDCPPAIAWQVRFFLLASDAYIVPTIPDRLSVRGARYLGERLRRVGVKIRPLGLLWSIRRAIETHDLYVRTVKTGNERLAFESDKLGGLPVPFRTVIPNAIDIIRPRLPGDPLPKSVKQKYKADMAEMFTSLCKEIVQRARQQSQKVEPKPALVTV